MTVTLSTLLVQVEQCWHKARMIALGDQGHSKMEAWMWVITGGSRQRLGVDSLLFPNNLIWPSSIWLTMDICWSEISPWQPLDKDEYLGMGL